MLVSFSLSNYKSFKKTASIQMSPGRSRSKKNHIYKDCLRVGAVFGSNASGKSNLISGLKTFAGIVTDPYYMTTDPIHNWDNEIKSEGGSDYTTFELEFTTEEHLYIYSLTVKPIGERKRKILQQRFSYAVVEEELCVADSCPECKTGYFRPVSIIKRINTEDLLDDLLRWKEQLDLTEKIKAEIASITNALSRSDDELSSITAQMKRYRAITSEGELTIDSSTSDDMIVTDSKERLISLERKRRNEYTKRRNLEKRLREKEQELEQNRSTVSKDQTDVITGYSPEIRVRGTKPRKGKNEENDRLIAEAYDWILNTLVILDTNDYALPVRSYTELSNLSAIIRTLDLGIEGLRWDIFDNNRQISRLWSDMDEKDYYRVKASRECSTLNKVFVSLIIRVKNSYYRFEYNNGEQLISKLSSIHSNEIVDLTEESDGTVRMIELASILLPAVKPKVFVIDELDRRMHPLMTRRFIELYLRPENEMKQLLFTTHETTLLSTALFRKDEIWFMEKRRNQSKLIPLDELSINNNRPVDRQYLEDLTLPGIPHIADILSIIEGH